MKPFPYKTPFSLRILQGWLLLNKPEQIGMRDFQYSWFAQMVGENRREFEGVPTVFLDAPRSVVQ